MPRLGGFIISFEECEKWGARVLKKRPEDVKYPEAFGALMDYLGRSGYDITCVCYPASVPKFMVVTQYAAHDGWKAGDDPTKLEQFKEGRTELVTRRALTRAG
jgi:hypothetical protein